MITLEWPGKAVLVQYFGGSLKKSYFYANGQILAQHDATIQQTGTSIYMTG
jgi:hypothetical protein